MFRVPLSPPDPHRRRRARRYGPLVLSAVLAAGVIAAMPARAPASPAPAIPSGFPGGAGAAPAHGVAAPDERLLEVGVRPGDTLWGILRRLGVSAATAHAVARARPRLVLRPGMRLRIRFRPGGELRAIATDVAPGIRYRVTRHRGRFDAGREHLPLVVRLVYARGTIRRSFLEDARAAGLPRRLIRRLVHIFGADIDFRRGLHPGDRFAVVYRENDWQGTKVSDGPIRAAEFVVRGRIYQAIAYRARGAVRHYYTPRGHRLHGAFLRAPLRYLRVTSRFNPRRYDPVLKRWCAHTGVDFGAPMGTPVMAAANGRVAFIGVERGYGKTVVLRHGGGYRTLYAHLSRFRAGLHSGSPVRRREVIGYVGRTGLATGPHLHYALRVKGVYRDPLTFPLPPSAPLPAAARAAFRARARVWSARLGAMLRPTRLARGG